MRNTITPRCHKLLLMLETFCQRKLKIAGPRSNCLVPNTYLSHIARIHNTTQITQQMLILRVPNENGDVKHIRSMYGHVSW